jgi:hypothetical protein
MLVGIFEDLKERTSMSRAPLNSDAILTKVIVKRPNTAVHTPVFTLISMRRRTMENVLQQPLI